ncbi:MAG: hypothetical protein K0R59_1997 [Sphingobacterium sp.]|jgi:hypothetical protein|nr:hypothetical protein [Sphingobacterium sp.]
MYFKTLLILLVFTAFSCSETAINKKKQVRIYYSGDFDDGQFGDERYLDRSYRNHSNSFFFSKNDTIPLAKWDSLIQEIKILKAYKPEVPYAVQLHNYCSNLEVEFFEGGESKCRLCYNHDKITVRYNNDLYYSTKFLDAFFYYYIQQDALSFKKNGRPNYMKKILVKD